MLRIDYESKRGPLALLGSIRGDGSCTRVTWLGSPGGMTLLGLSKVRKGGVYGPPLVATAADLVLTPTAAVGLFAVLRRPGSGLWVPSTRIKAVDGEPWESQLAGALRARERFLAEGRVSVPMVEPVEETSFSYGQSTWTVYDTNGMVLVKKTKATAQELRGFVGQSPRGDYAGPVEVTAQTFLAMPEAALGMYACFRASSGAYWASTRPVQNVAGGVL